MEMLFPHAVQIGVVMYIYEGYKGGGRAVKGRARDKITLDVTHIICHIHFKLTRLTVQARIPSSVTSSIMFYPLFYTDMINFCFYTDKTMYTER